MKPPKTSFHVFTTEQDKPLLLSSTLNWTTPDCGLAQYSYTHFIIKNLLIRITRLKLTKYFYEKFQQKIKIRVVKIKNTESNAFTKIVEGVKVSRFYNKILEIRITEPSSELVILITKFCVFSFFLMGFTAFLPLNKEMMPTLGKVGMSCVQWCCFQVLENAIMWDLYVKKTVKLMNMCS